MLEIEPGIDLRGGDIGVAQQLLHRAQIAAGLQQVAGKRVAQHMRMYGRGQIGFEAAALEALPD